MTKQTMTIREAREQGYTHYMFDGDELSFRPLSDIEQDIDTRDDINGERLVLCDKETWSIGIDPLWIVESATEDLHEEAKNNCLASESYMELVALCAKLNRDWEDNTKSYRPTNIFLIEETIL